MTQEQQAIQILSMQNDITAIKLQLTETQKYQLQMDKKLDTLISGISGNAEAGSLGLVHRVTELEQENKDLKEEIQTLKTSETRNGLYIKWIWALATALITAIFMYAMSIYFPKR